MAIYGILSERRHMQEYNCNENTNVYTRLEEEETLNFPIPEKAQDRTLLANLYAKGISNNRSADELKFADEYLEKWETLFDKFNR